VYRPEQVRALSGHPCRLISCGAQHTLALTIAGDLFAWGRGDERLGLGSIEQLGKGGGRDNNVTSPTLNKTYRDLSLSLSSCSACEYHSLVVDVDGRLWTFGKGGNGGVDDGRYVLIFLFIFFPPIRSNLQNQNSKKQCSPRQHTAFLVLFFIFLALFHAADFFFFFWYLIPSSSLHPQRPSRSSIRNSWNCKKIILDWQR
jgi:alpha-tubulin suppressor-like RCC1 family protein